MKKNKTKSNKICPLHPIKIPENRKIIFTDKKNFPWKKDRKGYFLVKVEKEFICCGFVNNRHRMILEMRGKNPDKIIKEIAKRRLCDLMHMGYIASELMIAKNAFEQKKKYIQR